MYEIFVFTKRPDLDLEAARLTVETEWQLRPKLLSAE